MNADQHTDRHAVYFRDSDEFIYGHASYSESKKSAFRNSK